MKTRKPKNAHSTRKRSGMKYRFKVWAEVDGEPVMGPGRYRLLEELRRTRSINAAAKKAGMSYRRVWAQIREMERLLGYSLIVSTRGGESGGGTELTPKALGLMRHYLEVQQAADKAVENLGAITGE